MPQPWAWSTSRAALLIFSAATGPTFGSRQSMAGERDLVERVVHEAQVREDVLHVREGRRTCGRW